jgi:hypothetical protein
MARVIMRGGTVTDPKQSLCETCRHAQVTTGANLNENYVHCYSAGEDVKFKVAQCNQYSEFGKQTLGEMANIAWVIEIDKRTRKMGFVSPAERETKGRKDSVLPDELY